jgi:putative N6-adenine-specific DNA methylase
MIRVRLGGGFMAHNFAALREGFKRLPWAAYLPRGSQPEVKVRCQRSALYHSDAVAERLREFLGQPAHDTAAVGASPGGDTTTGSVHVRIDRDRVQVSVDATGELYRRGYRRAIGAAPLRETLAAACVWASAATGFARLCDPFCGSGTLIIEACAMRAQLPACLRDDFPFSRWPSHQADRWRLRARTLSIAPPSGPWGMGFDIDQALLGGARDNAKRAAVGDLAQFDSADAVAAVTDLPAGTGILTNLPYGHRLSSTDALGHLFAGWGKAVQARPDLSEVWVLNGHPGFVAHSGLNWVSRLRFRNRGLPVALLQLAR